MSGFLSAGLICYISGSFFSSRTSLDFSEILAFVSGPPMICLIFVFLFSSSIMLYLRARTSGAYKGFRLMLMMDAPGANSTLTEMMDNTDLGICVSDKINGKILYANRRLRNALGSRTDLLSRGWTGDSKVPPLFMDFVSYERTDAFSDIAVSGWEGKSCPDGRWYSVKATEIRWLDGRAAILQTVYDIDSLKKRETGIREFTKGIMKARENELKRISSDLHEQVAQDLASLRIALDTVFYGVDLIPEKLVERTRNMSIVLQDAISHLREVAYGLTPSALDDFGVEKALNQCCHEFSEAKGIRVGFVCSGTHRITSDCELYINLYRIVQETLERFGEFTNPAHIRLSLVFSSSRIIVKFESDGKGYDLSTAKGSRLAEEELSLTSIRERVRLIGGEGFRINSGQGIGVVIHFEIPGDFVELSEKEGARHFSATENDGALSAAAESRLYKTNAAKKFLLFCKDDKNDSELRSPDQYQSHVRWRR